MMIDPAANRSEGWAEPSAAESRPAGAEPKPGWRSAEAADPACDWRDIAAGQPGPARRLVRKSTRRWGIGTWRSAGWQAMESVATHWQAMDHRSNLPNETPQAGPVGSSTAWGLAALSTKLPNAGWRWVAVELGLVGSGTRWNWGDPLALLASQGWEPVEPWAGTQPSGLVGSVALGQPWEPWARGGLASLGSVRQTNQAPGGHRAARWELPDLSGDPEYRVSKLALPIRGNLDRVLWTCEGQHTTFSFYYQPNIER